MKSVVMALCAVALLALCVPSATAYSVRLTYVHTPNGQMEMERIGYCTESDPASHTFMPATEEFNTLAQQTLSGGGGSQAPMGGYSRKAVCVDAACTWQYAKGYYDMNETTFYYGVYYNGVAKVAAVDGFYNGWDTGYPISWSNLSYWGKRQPVMLPTGKWQNVDVVTYFTDWVCEYYEYRKSDWVMFPTWLNGDPIIPTQSSMSYYSHCGKKIRYDSQHRLHDVQCNKSKFPWWAGLIIAVGCTVIVFTIIILVWCCCCIKERNAEEKGRQQKLLSTRDNPSNIPSQSEIGMSHNGSVTYSGEDDERSFSRSASDV